ncbi:MAG: FISUMP domain-containing protein [Dysgonamonadaceae bacterium]
MKTQMKEKLISRGFPLLLAAALMAGCSTEDKARLSGSGMRFMLSGVNDMPVETRGAALDSFSTVSVPLDNDFLMECTLKAEESSQTKATIPFTGNNTFRIFANDGSNVTDKGQFTAGSGNIILNLAPGSYTFSAYSYNNTASLPALPSGTTLLSGISPDNDLLYWKSDNIAIADNTNETRTITFNHLFPQVQVVVKANNGISDLPVSGLSATLRAGYTANMDVINGSLTSSGSPLTRSLTWASTGTTTTSNYCTVYPGTGGTINLDFTMSSVTVDGTTYTNKTVPFTGITLIPGKRYILSVNIYPLLFSPVYSVNTGTTILNRSAVFVKGSGDDKTRGTGVTHSSMSAGVFKYYNGGGRSYSAVSTTKNGITVSVPAGTMNMQSGEIPVSVSGTPTASAAGKAFDIPITILEQQLYVRVNVGCGAYTAAPTIPSLDGDAAWKQFQCFNLGADTSLDPFTYVEGNAGVSVGTQGGLFQWGRRADGHQLRNSPMAAGPASNTILNSDGQIITSSSHYGKFIYTRSQPHDCHSPQRNTLWGDGTTNLNPAKTPGDPCPPGWKVPSQAQWQSIYAGENGTSTNQWLWITGGRQIGNALFLPASGFRNYASGSLYTVGSNGRYWSSTTIGGCSRGLRFGSTYIDMTYNTYRAYGFSVRCVAD